MEPSESARNDPAIISESVAVLIDDVGLRSAVGCDKAARSRPLMSFPLFQTDPNDRGEAGRECAGDPPESKCFSTPGIMETALAQRFTTHSS